MSGKLGSKSFFWIIAFAALAFVAGAVLSLPPFSFIFSPFVNKPTLSESSLEGLPPLEIGDVILREGVGSDSLVIKQVSKHKYSHVGLVVSTQPILILHATTDDNKRAQNQVILSSFGEFLSHARAIAIKRYELSPATREQIALQAMRWEGRAFVLRAREVAQEITQEETTREGQQHGQKEEQILKISESDDSVLYCTTLLEQILSPYTELSVPYELMNVPGFRGEYLYPKAFYEDYNSRLIYEFSL